MTNDRGGEFTRRSFHRLAAGAMAAWLSAGRLAEAAMIDSKVNGVQIGAQSYSFRDRDLDAAIKAMTEIGIGECELYSGHLERAAGDDREALRRWRLNTPLTEFETVRKKFSDSGINLYALNYSFREDFTGPEIERGFVIAKALGVRVITASSNVSTAKRIDPYAKKYKMRVGMHNHSRIHEDEFATPADFDAARKGMSQYIAINLDIGHFVAAGFDPVDYIGKHHGDIVTLHIKDRKKNQGDNMPFGQGDTPIKQVLALLRDKKYDIPANIEYEYNGGDTVVEVRKCFDYCKQALA